MVLGASESCHHFSPQFFGSSRLYLCWPRVTLGILSYLIDYPPADLPRSAILMTHYLCIQGVVRRTDLTRPREIPIIDGAVP